MKVFIAGGSSFLGGYVIRAFEERGDEVVATYSNRKPNDKGRWLHMDVTDESSVEEALSQVGRIDCLVNLFGVFTEDDKDWQKIFDINVKGLYYVIRYAKEHLNGQSCIINTSSINACHPGFGGTSHYDASKGAVSAYTISLASELAPIRVNAIAPGLIDEPYLHSSPLESYYKTRAKLGKLVDAGELAKAFTFLCDNKAITGQIMTIDAGYLIG